MASNSLRTNYQIISIAGARIIRILGVSEIIRGRSVFESLGCLNWQNYGMILEINWQLLS